VLYVFYLGRSAYLLAQDGQFSAGAYLQSVVRKSWFLFFTLGFVGVFMGLVFVGIGMWSVLVILPLLLVFIYAYSRVAATDLYLLETIRVLSTIPEETGMIEKGHADRVTALSVDVARELGLSPEDTKQVEYAALLHDIGAITRKGAPGAQEPQLMEAEGVIAGGVDILGQVDYLEVAAEILRGREGLRDRVVDVDKRRAVSLGAGILRAVDDFESLIRGSETREPLSEHDALTEMNLERGVRYDSKVLRAIARVYPRIPQEGFEPRVGAGPEESDFWSEQ
jgi:HD-GYP domain-containing protein (c-di-GMP phosphodiesterase class II)